MSTATVTPNGNTVTNGQTIKQPFIQRDGKSVDIASVVIALDTTDKSLLYSLREEYEKRTGARISLPDLLSDVFSRGTKAMRNSWTWGDVNRETRKIEASAKADVADLLQSGLLTAEKKAQALDILLEAQRNAAEIKAAARKRGRS